MMTAIPVTVSPAPTRSQPIRPLAVHEPEPGDRAGDVDSTIRCIRPAGRRRVQGQEPRERRQACRAGDQEPGRAPVAEPEVRQVAAEDLGQGREHEEREGPNGHGLSSSASPGDVPRSSGAHVGLLIQTSEARPARIVPTTSDAASQRRCRRVMWIAEAEAAARATPQRDSADRGGAPRRPRSGGADPGRGPGGGWPGGPGPARAGVLTGGVGSPCSLASSTAPISPGSNGRWPVSIS